MPTPVKPGYRTTEFWVTMLTYLISILNFSGAWNFMGNWHNGLLLAVATFGYKLARGLAKAGVLHAPSYPLLHEVAGQPTSTYVPPANP